MKLNHFLLSSDECELLLAFEINPSIEKVAQAIGKDPSGVSRQLAAIAAKYPALEKCGGRWTLTEIGRLLNNHTRNAIQVQKRLIKTRSLLRLGTNREFASRVIGPQFAELMRVFSNFQISLSTFEQGTEEALLNGKIDIGIDCGRPNDPDIAYKMLLEEPIVSVCSPEFKRTHQKEIKSGRLYQTPHLLCERLYPDRVFSESENRLNVTAFFNDISSARAACEVGVGWSLLPRYAVATEIDSGKLVVIGEKRVGKSRYGVWWRRNRSPHKDLVDKTCKWVSSRSL